MNSQAVWYSLSLLLCCSNTVRKIVRKSHKLTRKRWSKWEEVLLLLRLPCAVQTPSCGWHELGWWLCHSSGTCCSNTGLCSHTVWPHLAHPLNMAQYSKSMKQKKLDTITVNTFKTPLFNMSRLDIQQILKISEHYVSCKIFAQQIFGAK